MLRCLLSGVWRILVSIYSQRIYSVNTESGAVRLLCRLSTASSDDALDILRGRLDVVVQSPTQAACVREVGIVRLRLLL
jgi:hypothetical protein